jgi:hypothetical protein
VLRQILDDKATERMHTHGVRKHADAAEVGFERVYEISCYSTPGLLARVIPAGPGNPNSIAGYKDSAPIPGSAVMASTPAKWRFW